MFLSRALQETHITISHGVPKLPETWELHFTTYILNTKRLSKSNRSHTCEFENFCILGDLQCTSSQPRHWAMKRKRIWFSLIDRSKINVNPKTFFLQNEKQMFFRWIWKLPCYNLKKFLFLSYFWLYWVFIARAFDSCSEQGHSIVALCGLFIAVASLVAENRL